MKKRTQIIPSSRENADNFAETVTAARVKLGLTQDAFARLLETPLGTIRGWEQARRKPPPCAMLLMRVAVDHPEAIIEVSKRDSAQAAFEQKPKSSKGIKKAKGKNQVSAELHEPGEDADFWLL